MVKCLQKKLAISWSVVVSLLLKLIGWLGGTRSFFPVVLVMSHQSRPVSCVCWQDSFTSPYCFLQLGLIVGFVFVQFEDRQQGTMFTVDRALGQGLWPRP